MADFLVEDFTALLFSSGEVDSVEAIHMEVLVVAAAVDLVDLAAVADLMVGVPAEAGNCCKFAVYVGFPERHPYSWA